MTPCDRCGCETASPDDLLCEACIEMLDEEEDAVHDSDWV